MVLFDSLQQQQQEESEIVPDHSHLVRPQVVNMTGQCRLPPSHHGPVLNLVRELGEFVLTNLCTQERYQN